MTKTLRTEIAAGEERRRALSSEIASIVQEHENARAQLLKNQGDNELKSITITHARRAALEEAMAALDSTLEQKRQLLQQKEKEESRQSALQRVEACERESEAAALEYRQRRIEAHQIFEQAITPAYEALKRWHDLRKELRELQVSVGRRPERVIDRIDGVEALHPFGPTLDAAISVLSEALRRGVVEERRKEAQRRQERAEQLETERINAFYKEAAERARRGLRIGPPAAA